MEKAPKKSWPGSMIIVVDILATISIGRQLRSSMNSDGSSDVSSDYGRYPSGLLPVAMDHPELLRLSFSNAAERPIGVDGAVVFKFVCA